MIELTEAVIETQEALRQLTALVLGMADEVGALRHNPEKKAFLEGAIGSALDAVTARQVSLVESLSGKP